MKLPVLDRRLSSSDLNGVLPGSTNNVKKMISDLPENPFRKEIRRLSVNSVPTPCSRGTNMHKKRISTLEEIFRPIGTQKRHSIPSITRPSLRNVGARVTSMIRAKNVLARIKAKVKPKEDIVSDEVFEIKEMPTEPRFASTLSPEAQYATMKGYEDVVYHNICQLYPENLPTIRRNKTPMPGVRISIADQNRPTNSKPAARNLMSLRNVFRKQTEETKVTTNESTEASLSTPLPGDNEDTQSPKQASPRNLFPVQILESKANPEKIEIITPTKDNQLVLTYRYQRAMDLLDVLRQNQGAYPLSPRRSLDKKVEPLKEYNNWAYVWTHHFEKKAIQDTR